MYSYYTYTEYILHGIKGTGSPLALYRLHRRRRTLRGRTPHRARTDGRTPGVFPRVCRTAPTSAQHSRLLRRPCIAATALAAASRTQRPTLNRRNSAWHSTVHRRPTCKRASTQAYEKRRGTFPHRHSTRVSSLSVRPPHTLYTPASAQYGLPGPSLPTVVEPSSGIHWSPRPI